MLYIVWESPASRNYRFQNSSNQNSYPARGRPGGAARFPPSGGHRLADTSPAQPYDAAPPAVSQEDEATAEARRNADEARKKRNYKVLDIKDGESESLLRSDNREPAMDKPRDL